MMRYLLLLFTALCLSIGVEAQIPFHGAQPGMNNFYVDYSTGSDSNPGTSKALPWKTFPAMPCGTNAHAFNANDAYIGKGGVTWPHACFGQWSINAGGTGTPTLNNFPGMAFTYDPTWNNGTVVSVRPTDSGDQCTSVVVTITPAPGDTTGSGATATATLATGYLSGLVMWYTVTSPGSSYTLNPIVSFSGSVCNRFPKALAFITSPIWDGTGIFGTSTTLPTMIRLNQNYVTIDGYDIGHYLWDPAYSSISAAPSMISVPSGTHITFQNNFIHHMGQSGPAQALNSTMDGATAAMINAQQADNAGNTITGNWLSNWEITANGCSSGHVVTGPCGTQTLSIGMKIITYNYYWASRGNIYTVAGSNDHLVAHNIMWGCLDSTSTQHPDTYYLQGGGVTNNNIFHDGFGGCAALYLEIVNGASPVALGMTHYVFNNIIWNTGTSTPPLSGGSAEFANASTTSVSPQQLHFVVNNLGFGQEAAGGGVSTAGSGLCGDSGQWYQSSPSFSWAFTIGNNVCITNNGTSWRSVTVCPSGCQIINGTFNFPQGLGVWNGVSPPNGTAGQAALNNANTTISTVTASNEKQVIANLFAPTASTNSSVLFFGTNYTSLCSTSFNGLSLAELCKDFNGNPRPATGPWNAGPYQFTSAPSGAVGNCQENLTTTATVGIGASKRACSP